MSIIQLSHSELFPDVPNLCRRSRVIEEDVDELRQLKPDEFPETISAEDLVCFDDGVVVATEFSTDEEILAWAKREDAEKSDDEDEDEEVVEIDAEVSCPTASELHSATGVIRRYSLFPSTGSQDLRDMGENLEKRVYASRKSNMKQKKINEFFKKM